MNILLISEMCIKDENEEMDKHFNQTKIRWEETANEIRNTIKVNTLHSNIKDKD